MAEHESTERMAITDEGDHEYLVEVRGRPGEAESRAQTRVRVPTELLEQLPRAGGDTEAVVAATVDWLLERQQAADLPPFLDLDDVVAGYDGFLDGLRARLARSG
ncbi:hypothetical protein [Streptacidiphilus monticola]|jgi:hypothetical protein|uniref:Phage tail assembly protein n=1 Tax=Streptacidiphilus monticola TaxID=2161674 RepID=A0ABW1GCR0_9ACTN